MEKIILIFCDLQGTVFSKCSNKDEDYLNLKQIIEDISSKSECKIIFSLASSDSSDYVMDSLKIISSFIPKIKENIHFFSNGYILKDKIIITNANSKLFQIVDYINEMNKICDIKEIIIIDDCEFNHEIIKTCISEEYFNEKIKSLIPSSENGLSEVNELLQNKNAQDQQFIKRKMN